MLTDRERIAKLEAELVELRSALNIAGAMPVFVLQAALDQMVDERFLSAETRTEIWARVRREVRVVAVGSTDIARAAEHAIPRYASKADRAEIKAISDRVRKEPLGLRLPSRERDQSRGSPKVEPEPE